MDFFRLVDKFNAHVAWSTWVDITVLILLGIVCIIAMCRDASLSHRIEWLEQDNKWRRESERTDREAKLKKKLKKARRRRRVDAFFEKD